MNQANPFEASPRTALGRAHEASALPRYLLGVALLVVVIDILLMTISMLKIPVVVSSGWLLRVAPVSWASSLLMGGLSVYWLAQVYLERHGLDNYRQPMKLLLMYGLAYLLLAWLGRESYAYLYLWGSQQMELLQNSGWASLFWWVYDLALFAIKSLLLLWLFLHLFRHTAETTYGPVQVAGGALAWCFASAIVLVYLQLSGWAMQQLSGMLYSYALDGWRAWIILVPGLLYLLVAFFAARSALPKQVQGFNGGRLALACLITLLLWIGSAVLCTGLMVALLLLGSRGDSILLLLLGLSQLVLLWPFTRLGLRWGYRAHAAV